MTAPTTVSVTTVSATTVSAATGGCPTIGAPHREHTRAVTATRAAHSRHLISTRRGSWRIITAGTPSLPRHVPDPTPCPHPHQAVCALGIFAEDALRSMRKILAL